MEAKEAFEIVLKLAKANTLAEHEIMYAQQEAQASLERQASGSGEGNLDYDENIREE